MEPYNRENLINAFQKIHRLGWTKETRNENQGSAGNTLEYLLRIGENNLSILNATERKLKAHKLGSTSFMILLHSEPSSKLLKLVPT